MLSYQDLLNKQIRTDLPKIQIGQLLSVSIEVQSDKKRKHQQTFKGLCIKKSKFNSLSASFVLWRFHKGLGIQKNFKYNSPLIKKITINASYKVRRAKLYYITRRRSSNINLKQLKR